jgi:hypothetical protein
MVSIKQGGNSLPRIYRDFKALECKRDAINGACSRVILQQSKDNPVSWVSLLHNISKLLNTFSPFASRRDTAMRWAEFSENVEKPRRI